jgi:predicted GIY-YIG superfamily endonuclease
MPSEALAKEGCRVHYVYLLQSETVTGQRYIGITSKLKDRLAEHNAGKSTHTSKFVPGGW